MSESSGEKFHNIEKKLQEAQDVLGISEKKEEHLQTIDNILEDKLPKRNDTLRNDLEGIRQAAGKGNFAEVLQKIFAQLLNILNAKTINPSKDDVNFGKNLSSNSDKKILETKKYLEKKETSLVEKDSYDRGIRKIQIAQMRGKIIRELASRNKVIVNADIANDGFEISPKQSQNDEIISQKIKDYCKIIKPDWTEDIINKKISQAKQLGIFRKNQSENFDSVIFCNVGSDELLPVLINQKEISTTKMEFVIEKEQLPPGNSVDFLVQYVLRPGDIIAVQGRNDDEKWLSKVFKGNISEMQGHWTTHTMTYLGNGKIMNTDTKGTREDDLKDIMLNHTTGHYIISRHKNPSVGEKLVKKIRELYQKMPNKRKYDYLGSDENSYFCTELIVKASNEIGANFDLKKTELHPLAVLGQLKPVIAGQVTI